MLWLFLTYSYFLGLRTLTVIQKAKELIKRNKGIDIDFADYDDAKVYATISSGNTDGIFQLESAGMKQFMKELAPTNIEDVIAGVSLYRPGPMDFIPKYIKGKNDSANITYTHPALETILKNTYGCIVYQEQVMQIVRKLGGYSLGRSDLLRRAMGKKKTEVMLKEREIFINGNGEDISGAVNNGIDAAVANQIFDDMVDFAKYAFNKSHAAAYSIISYQTAYLKTHHRLEFMAALMTSVKDSIEKVEMYITSLKKQNIKMYTPDINTAIGEFSTVEDGIVYGLYAVKCVGEAAVDDIIKERNENGNFKSLTDFCKRLHIKDVRKRMIEALIYAGAFDSLGGSRGQYLAIYEGIIAGILYNNKKQIAGQLDLFSMGDENNDMKHKDEFPNIEELSKKELLDKEKEVLGVYLSGHPLGECAQKLEMYTTHHCAELHQKNEIYNELILGGMITNVREFLTKKGQRMAFIELEDLTGACECIVFENYYAHLKKVDQNVPVLIKGRISLKDDDVKVIVNFIENIEAKPLVITLNAAMRTPEISKKLLEVFAEHRGTTTVAIENEESGEIKPYPAKYNIKINAEFTEKLKAIVGDNRYKMPNEK